MEPLLYLTHRIPFPPNKGDKVRSYHLLKHLAARYRVFLGTFVDDAADLKHVPELGTVCAEACVRRIVPAIARVRSLVGLMTGEPLTLPYFRDRELARWVTRIVEREGIDHCVVFSSTMAQYVEGMPNLRKIVDFVDVDSAKWTDCGARRRWPVSSIYRREGAKLLAFERRIARQVDSALFVTAAEAALFRHLAPESADRVTAMENGVDAAYFSPEHALASPYPAGELPVVFTGTMDYWPNADAVHWFASECLPGILAARPAARFYVVGANPGRAVRALAKHPGVSVTGRVPDIRPYLRHAKVVVAPLRIARGVQNKVLEAMAMARPVVASTACASGLDARPGVDLEVAATPLEFTCTVLELLNGVRAGPLGLAARERVLERYQWPRNLAAIDRLLAGSGNPEPALSAASRRAVEPLAT